MGEKTRVYWLHALTPLHVGAGRGLGYIDLPIMREKVTNWPLVPGSSIKGVISDIHGAEGVRAKIDGGQKLDEKESKTVCAFGRAGDEHSSSGSLVFTDSHIVCLPARSLYGTFAWCTSSLALQRLTRDLQQAGAGSPAAPLEAPTENTAWVADKAKCRLQDTEGNIYVEDLDLVAGEQGDASAWADWLAQQIFADQGKWIDVFKERFVIVPDDVFDFLCETGTEVNARIRIDDEQKTVAKGALWYEEALPAETILSGLIWCDRVFAVNGQKPKPEELFQTFCHDPLSLQIGGKATVGHGRVRCVFAKGGQSS